MEDQLFAKQYITVLHNLRKEIEDYDNEIFENKNKLGYVETHYRERSIATEFGNLRVKRREYSYLDKNLNRKKICPVDVKFNFGKRNRIHPSLKKKILNEAGSGKRYRDIIDMFPRANISTMSVSRIFHDCDYIEKMGEVKKRVQLKFGQVIYINTDDTYASVYDEKLKAKYDQRFRVVSFHLGYENPKVKRKKLKDKRMFFLDDDVRLNSSKRVADEILAWGNKFYKGIENAKIVVGGDGATWIKNVAKCLNGEYVLDNFHAQAYLMKAFGITKNNIIGVMKNNRNRYNLYRIAYTYFLAGNWEGLIEILKSTKVSKTVLSYFEHNANGVKSWAKSWNIGVSAECDCSRLVKSTLGYGSKMFSKTVLFNLIGARAYKINNYGQY